MMTIYPPPRHQSPVHEMDGDRDPAIGDTVVVKTVSSTAAEHQLSSDSELSSVSSSPGDDLQIPTSQTHPSVYPTSDSNNSFHKRKLFRVEKRRRTSPRGQYDYTPPKRRENRQHMAEHAMRDLGTSNDHQQYYRNDHAWNQAQAQPLTDDVGEDQWDHSPRADSQGHESTTSGANGIMPKRKRKFCKRTKTGCMTCRRKKKKCGEERPQCEYNRVLLSHI